MLIDVYFALPSPAHPSRTTRKFFWYLLLLANIAAISFIWYTKSSYYIEHPADGNIFKALGRLTGLFAELAILLEIILIGRITAIEQTFGHDKMNKIHRWIGYSILTFMLAHPILLIMAGAAANGYTFMQQLGDYLANWDDVFEAFVALIIFAYVIVLSVPVVRKRLKYETWYFTHFLVYLAIGLAFSHQINTGDVSKPYGLQYWLALNFTVFGVMLLFRFLRPLWNAWRFEFRVSGVAMETKDTYSVYITGKNIEKFRYQAGQFSNIIFLQRGLWYPHPFSFSAEPNSQCVRFTIKALGDYTKRLGELKKGTRVIIDGPLGLFVDKLALREKLLFIAGGIGITPIRALIGHLINEKKDFVLMYAARSVEDIAFKNELAALKEMHPFALHYVLGTPTPGYESGFIDREKIVRLVPDFFDRDVFLCGPPPMMAATVKNLQGLGLPIKNIHFEKFSF